MEILQIIQNPKLVVLLFVETHKLDCVTKASSLGSQDSDFLQDSLRLRSPFRHIFSFQAMSRTKLDRSSHLCRGDILVAH